ncbi:MAG: zf-HC2 domain-containing protein [Gemmatimonadaceae bacterium]
MTDTVMTCERLEELLPDYLDGTLGELDRLAVEQHLAGCPACGPLVADVRGIVAEAAALPALQPSRDLWAGIEARIATPVVSIGADAAPARRSRFASRGWLAAAAVLLVVTTAGVTYEVTRRMAGGTTSVAQRTFPAAVQRVVSALPASPLSPTITDQDAVAEPSAPQAEGRGREAAQIRERSEPRTASPKTMPRTAPKAPRATPETRLVGNPASESPASLIEGPYAKELRELALMVSQRRGDLDPATIAVLEHSLKVIDTAIAQSRDALRRDPASGFLQEQLNHALDKKVMLLRTAARLPDRT